jgi:thymidylate synthase ThyX
MIPVMNRLKELGIRNEDIRCIFPNAMSTSIQVTMNFREVKHLLELRLDSHAQDEIREMSYALLCMLSAHMPFIWNHSSILQ